MREIGALRQDLERLARAAEVEGVKGRDHDFVRSRQNARRALLQEQLLTGVLRAAGRRSASTALLDGHRATAARGALGTPDLAQRGPSGAAAAEDVFRGGAGGADVTAGDHAGLRGLALGPGGPAESGPERLGRVQLQLGVGFRQPRG